jgi:nucleoside-diphosphate-sugar epimerase
VIAAGSRDRPALVLGAGGLLGLRLVERLRREGHQVRAFVPTGSDEVPLGNSGAEVVTGDIRREADVGPAILGCGLVFNLAAKMSGAGAASPELAPLNVQGAQTVVRAAENAQVERLVHVGTYSVYGLTRSHSIDESTPVDPDSAYGRSEARAEQIMLDSVARVPVVVARLSSLFGAGSLSWLPLFRAVLSGQFRLLGSGNNLHHPAAVTDAVAGLLLCAGRGAVGRTYLLAGPEPLPLRAMVEHIAESVGADGVRSGFGESLLRLYKLVHDSVPDGLQHRLPRYDRVEFFLADRAYDISRAREELGYAPGTRPREAILETGDWYRAQRLLEGESRAGA